MDNTAYFFCDIDNYEMLLNKTENAQRMNYRRQKYRIIKTVILNDEHFEKFKNDICEEKEFLQNSTAKLKLSEKGEYICLAVANKHSDTIFLVCTFQYSYPKFVAIVRRNSYGEKIY